jgi:hypothetical protein
LRRLFSVPEEASMTDEKKCPHCGGAAETMTVTTPVLWLESAITSHREASRVDRNTVGLSDAITIASVVLAVLVVLMLLTTSRDGVSVFLSGIAVGGIAGILLWSMSDRLT